MNGDRPESRTADALSVSVVICCYNMNRWDDLCAATQSALDQHTPLHEIVIVVDHNVALKAAVQSRFPTLCVVENRNARGLSGARNTGVAVSSGSLIMFLDDDAVAGPAMIRSLHATMEDSRVLGAVAMIRPLWLGRPPRWFPHEFLWVVGCSYLGMTPGRVRNLIGAAMCIRRSVFDRVGGFTDGVGRASSRLPYGCEETELCIRANAAHPDSWFVYDPAAVCLHKVSEQRTTLRYFSTRAFAEGWSKAHIGALVRSDAALSSERSYVTGALIPGFLRGWRQLFTKGDVFAALNALAIAFGLFVTVAGYAAAKAKFAIGASPRPEDARGAARVTKPLPSR